MTNDPNAKPAKISIAETTVDEDAMSKRMVITVSFPPNGSSNLNEALEQLQEFSDASPPRTVLAAKRRIAAGEWGGGETDISKGFLAEAVRAIEQAEEITADAPSELHERIQAALDQAFLAGGLLATVHTRAKYLQNVARVRDAVHALAHDNEGRAEYNKMRKSEALKWHSVVHKAISGVGPDVFWKRSRSMQAEYVLRALKKSGFFKSKGTVENYLRKIQE